jgi:hypothetical protein
MKITVRCTRNYWSPHVAMVFVIQSLWLVTVTTRKIAYSNSPERSVFEKAEVSQLQETPHLLLNQKFITVFKTAYLILP